MRNLTKVVNSATEQIENQKKGFLHNLNKSVNARETAIKNELYKDLGKKVERYRHMPNLPKIKVNSKEHAGLYERSYQSIDYHNMDDEPALHQVLDCTLSPTRP